MASKLPIVSIVGRQNVGKSTLFNAIIKDKKSIVDPVPGLTRDIISHSVIHNNIGFILSDTPGLDISSSAELSAEIIANAQLHLSKSSLIILLLEAPDLDSFDFELANIVRKINIPVIVAVNKIDSNEKMEYLPNFYELGFNELIPISALRRFNVNLLLDNITRLLPVKKTSIPEPDIKIAIIGRPNSGKSTLLNSFIGYQRSIVSDIPGTTRDSVDETFSYHGKTIQIIDTAGIRKKSKISENIEFYSLTRTIDSIKRCDIAIHLIDATVGLTENDKKISDEIIKSGKPVIIAINKWDCLEKDHKTFNEFKDKLIFKFYRAADFPIISISAKNKLRIDKLLQTALMLKEKSTRRIDTPTLNRIIAEIKNKARIPQLGETIKVYYAVQTETMPPRFKFFVNNEKNFRKDTIRYFEKALKEELDMEGLPVIIEIEGKKRDKKNKN
ncbi:MAG TPA: ribosome biogenesis GTPase Der [Spirochaetota bacterium]|jgi:GTP-binding protein|nr:ribosome biogenesis GTPase Der [Spirochaetota bacterium]OQA98903.1 MAG: GTPase Der [Spirochaetes bacterium ADurb.Bin218]HOK02305.1 ribosome biogenesis GTPase Der [Spirochaetota bacterium]HON15438.1 ribosome biogenesis GTPase Der [Spirochaetota bacterium]HOV08596.1 ribosome biogenesis GTPase Der [Spirochaetota bacterium]